MVSLAGASGSSKTNVRYGTSLVLKGRAVPVLLTSKPGAVGLWQIQIYML